MRDALKCYITTGWRAAPESPGEETSELSAKDGQSEIKTADTPSENEGKPERKRRPQTAKAPRKTAVTARAAAVPPQTSEPKSAPAQAEP